MIENMLDLFYTFCITYFIPRNLFITLTSINYLLNSCMIIIWDDWYEKWYALILRLPVQIQNNNLLKRFNTWGILALYTIIFKITTLLATKWKRTKYFFSKELNVSLSQFRFYHNVNKLLCSNASIKSKIYIEAE